MIQRFLLLFLMMFLCTSGVFAAPPLAEYRFDETEYSDVPNEIIDSIGGFNGQAKSSQPIDGGKVCNAIDLSAGGTADYAILDESLVNGKTDFTVSLWAQSSKTTNQSVISGAGANHNEMLMWFTSHTTFQPHIKHSQNGTITTGTIADNLWHHFVWTRQGSQSCLYRDKVLQGCVTQSTQALDVQSLILGQEQDSVGGSFSSSQAFDGLIDELLIFDSAISITELEDIYDNQNVGLGYDGSARICPPPPPITPPVLDMRFDENEWSEANSVLDSSGNDFHGSPTNVTPVLGLVCNAADMSASGISDYITLDNRTLDNSKKFSISLWYQTPKTSNQSLISGSNPSSFNELIMWFSNNTRFSPFLHGATSSIDTANIAGDEWHHLVWTRSGSTNTFYLDGVLQVGNAGLSAETLDITSLILGQEQDSIGGGFDSSQAVEGLIDELLVFDRTISATEVNDIFVNQTNGLNYDGTERTCLPPLPLTPPVLDMRFDENSWFGADSVLDSSGNDFHATPTNVFPVLGLVCNAADMTASGINDYITLDNRALDDRNKFTISLWYKTPKTSNQSLISGSNPSSYNELIMWFTSSTRFSPFLHESTKSIDTDSIAIDEWHHLVWTRSGSTNRFYRDGVLQTGSAILSSETLDISSLILGQEQDSLGGNFDSSQAVEGLIDELLVFDRAISATEVNEIFVNQTNGLNYDASTRTCAPELILDMRFNEGSGQTTVDSSGNERTGTLGSSIGIDVSDPTWACEANGYYLDFDRSKNQYVRTNSFTPPGEGSFAFWFKVPEAPTARQRIFGFGDGFEIRWEANDIMYFDINKTGTNSSIRSSSAITQTDTWIHIAFVSSVENNTWSLYIDGVLDNEGTESLSSQPASVLTLGGSTWKLNGEHFTGSLEDFKIYSGLLSATEIAALAASPPTDCAATVDHFEINHDGQGLTCDAENIIIKACADATCSTLINNEISVELLINGTSDKTVTISEGSASTSFSYTDTITPATLSLNEAYECMNGDSTSCEVEFSDAGFRFLYGASESEIIGNQVSGDNFIDELKLQAVENVNGVCTGLFTGEKEVELSQENIAPGGTTGLSFNINNAPINKYPSFTSNVTLNFGDDSKATIVNPAYLDAGQISFHAKYNADGVSLTGNSNGFWVSPARLVMTATSEGEKINGASKTSPTVHEAGVNFDFEVTAYNSMYDESKDDNSGHITANYVPNGIQLLVTRAEPTSIGSVDGEFIYGSGFIESSTSPIFQGVILATFNSGISITNNASYSEVGLLTIGLQDIGYGYSENIIKSDALNIGRFIPSYFELAKTDGVLAAYCDNDDISEEITFAYSGQMSTATPSKGGVIRYKTKPSFTITAKSKNGVNTTLNYTGDFMRLEADGITRLTPTIDASTDGVLGLNNKMKLVADLNAITTADLQNDEFEGVVIYSYHSDDNFIYVRDSNAEYNEFISNIYLQIVSVIDQDGVMAIDADGDFDGGDPTNALDTVLTLEPTGVEVRFGRAYLANSFGPETSKLPQELSVQYLKDNKYILATDDVCSLYNSDQVSFGANEVGIVEANIDEVDGTFGEVLDLPNGITRAIELPAAGTGNRGEVEVIYSIYDWLKYDWNNIDEGSDGLIYDDDPSATATFGIFRGNDRIIYQREVNN